MANPNQPQILPIVARPIVFKKPRSVNIDLTRLNPLAKEQIPSCTSYESKLNFDLIIEEFASLLHDTKVLVTNSGLRLCIRSHKCGLIYIAFFLNGKFSLLFIK